MRFLVKNPKCKVQSFVCPVTGRDSLEDGCDAANARHEGNLPSGPPILGKFRCACGKTLYTRILSDGVEVTKETLDAKTR